MIKASTIEIKTNRKPSKEIKLKRRHLQSSHWTTRRIRGDIPLNVPVNSPWRCTSTIPMSLRWDVRCGFWGQFGRESCTQPFGMCKADRGHERLARPFPRYGQRSKFVSLQDELEFFEGMGLTALSPERSPSIFRARQSTFLRKCSTSLGILSTCNVSKRSIMLGSLLTQGVTKLVMSFQLNITSNIWTVGIRVLYS